MSKLAIISATNVLFCTFMINFIRGILFNDNLCINYILISYTLSAILLFIYQRWINKRVLPYFAKNKHKYDVLSLALSYTIVGIIIGRCLTVINVISYVIKICNSVKYYYYTNSDMNTILFILCILQLFIFILISGIAMQGFLDLKIKDIKNLRWRNK